MTMYWIHKILNIGYIMPNDRRLPFYKPRHRHRV